ncbi:MAG: UvrD-helicase domain-containing protein, partial [Desulfomonilaceae bacterium]
MKSLLAPPDQIHRDAILEDLGSTILVEAAAGTGKTTSIVGRMTRLLAEGVAEVERMAAVTFTRKAAAELADRFHRTLQAEASRSVAQEKNRLERAILSLDRCFIGTIHSFCGRLLRERPLEAGLPLDFEEIDEQEDQRIRSRVWEDFVEHTYRSQDPMLGRLEDLGLQLEDLAASFLAICDYEDVEEWPAEEVVMPDLEPGIVELEALVAHIEPLVRDFPDDSRKDDLITAYERVVLAFRQAPRIRSAPQLMDVLSQFKAVKSAPRYWPGGQKQARAELERLNNFIERVAGPLLKQWRECRYSSVMEVLLSALRWYRARKLELCKLNFQDLLLYTARMLQKNPSIRRYFKKRYSHILVDEFQDTDPIQAEVLFYLTADDPCETDWKKCRPTPGSLFVVGDPKQSIYRFRRADIITYNEVKRIIAETGGRIITLSANFRTVGPLIDWVNDFFPARFAEQPPGTSPSYV